MHDFNVSFLHKNIACVEIILLAPLCVQHVYKKCSKAPTWLVLYWNKNMCMNTTVNRFLGNVACPGISFFL